VVHIQIRMDPQKICLLDLDPAACKFVPRAKSQDFFKKQIITKIDTDGCGEQTTQDVVLVVYYLYFYKILNIFLRSGSGSALRFCLDPDP
jgi:hypothetical protein